MDVKTQTVEQYLFEQLEKIAPGKYTLANVLQLFRHRLRFPCTHLKGRYGPPGHAKDYNLSIFTFPTGVIEVKCLYNCGLKVRSDQKDLIKEFNELYDLPTSNSKASAENVYPKADPGPVPVYTDEDRKRIRESADIFLKMLVVGVENGRIKMGDPILGGNFPHPDPIEAPDSIIGRTIKFRHAALKNKPPVLKATAVVQDSVPALKPVKKIRKRKTQSRKRG